MRLFQKKTFFYLHKFASWLYPFLFGSVIPFVVLRDVKSCLSDGLNKVNEKILNLTANLNKKLMSYNSMFLNKNQDKLIEGNYEKYFKLPNES